MVTWAASPSAGVVGYNVYYGTQSGYYPDQISVSGTNEWRSIRRRKRRDLFFCRHRL